MTLVSTLGQSLNQLDRLKNLQLQLADMQTQMATGKKTQLFKGLGTDVLASERARADLKAVGTYDSNIDTADRRLKIMLSAIQEIRDQAATVLNAIDIQTQKGEFEMEAVGDLAGKVRDFVTNLMNQKDGDRYLFGGAETQGLPLSDTGPMDTYIKTRLTEWSSTTLSTDNLIASYRDRAQLTDTTMGFSITLSSGNAKNVSIRVDAHTEVDYTVLANDPALRDIVTALGMMKNVGQVLDEVTLDAGDPSTTVTAPGADKKEQSDNFYKMFNDVGVMLSNALDRMDQIAYTLSETQAHVSSIQDNNKVEKNVLQDQIDGVENVDMNEIAVKLNALRVQMEASYSITSWIRDLNLVNYLR